MEESYVNFPIYNFFVNITDSYPKIYWPKLEIFLLEELKKIPIPNKPKPPLPPGCFATLFGNSEDYNQKYKEYKKQLVLTDLKYDNAKKAIINTLTNPRLHPDTAIPLLNEAVRRSYTYNKSIVSKKGIAEKQFYVILKSYFGDNILINKGISDGVNLPYIPDFIFYDNKRNLHIDIEIDEPYRIETGEPTHYNYVIHRSDNWEVNSSDEKRDNLFMRKGWFIIKFSEKQVFKYPESCCKVISDLLKSVFDDMTFSEVFSNVEDIIPYSAYSISDCVSLESAGYREGYLDVKINRPKFTINSYFKDLIEEYLKFENYLASNDYW
jgi:hypothetical protein